MPELTDWEPQLGALVALTIYVVGLAGAFGVRAWLHFRRTGDAGFRRTPATHPVGRLGMVLFGSALVLYGVALTLGIFYPSFQWPMPAAVSWLGMLVAVAGVRAVFAAQGAMGSSWRVGVDPDETTDLVVTGPFALVRNPIFTAMGVICVGLTLLAPSWITVLALIAFCVGVQLQVRLVEEPALERLHGDAYRSYAAKVGRFFPGIGRRLG